MGVHVCVSVCVNTEIESCHKNNAKDEYLGKAKKIKKKLTEHQKKTKKKNLK